MSKEKAKQFLKEYRDNEEAMKILKQFPKEAEGELVENDLEDVAGGIYYLSPYGERIYAGCYGDFTDDNCFNTDACNKVNIYYYDCKYTFHPEGDEYNCTWNEANPFKKG